MVEQGSKPIRRVLVANRGEIAVRIIRGAKDLDIETVAVYADSDRDAPFVEMADETIALGGNRPATTYLDGKKLVEVALRSGVDALHPGYGFLSESADFAGLVNKAGLVWIGPPENAIRLLGDKLAARDIARQVGAALAPGSEGMINDVNEVRAFVDQHGLPVVIKAAFGGGGRGMRVVSSREAIQSQFESAQREAIAAFGRGECFVERYLEAPRHIEAQILADVYGSVMVVGTRDCTLQRRHQKIVEEAPAPFLTPGQLEIISKSAKDICRAGGYVGAGTVEFLLGRDGSVSFLEVNTRLQVEHSVTEEAMGIDLVTEQFRIAAGEPLRWTEQPAPLHHSFEFRINAEDPANNFLPSFGTISALSLPAGPGVRIDAGVASGTVIDGHFDSLLAKLIVTGADRAEAIRRARRALSEISVTGVATLISLHRAIVQSDEFSSSDAAGFLVHTEWIESEFIGRHDVALANSSDAATDATIEIGGRPLVVRLPNGLDPYLLSRKAHDSDSGSSSDLRETVTSPMQGTVVTVIVSEGQVVVEGDPLFIVEAMKMENAVLAHGDGTVSNIAVTVGQSVRQGLVLCRLLEDMPEV